MRSLRPLFVLITGLMLALASMSIATPTTAQADGFHGDVKIHQSPHETEPPGDPKNNNEPKICGAFHIHGTGFDVNAAGWWAIYDWTGSDKGTEVRSGDWSTGPDTDWWTSDSITLDNGHYKLEYDYGTGEVSGNAKSKVFKVDCATPTEIVPLTLTSMCSFHPDVTREWRVRNSNDFAVPFTWEVYGTTQTGTGTAIANGDVFFTTQTVPGGGPNTTKIYWSGGETVKASNPAQCEPVNGNLRVFKYNDLNGNGGRDEGEPGLAGWDFTVTPQVGATLQVQSSTLETGNDPLGMGILSLPEGAYQVCENTPLPTYWTNTDPGPGQNGTCKTGSVSMGKDSDIVYFGNRYFQPLNPTPTPTPPGTLQIVKYNDLDRNGTRGSAEPVLSGFSFQVKAGATVQATLTTSAAGTTSLTLLPGVYSVSELALTGWVNTDPGGTAPTKTVTITSGQVSTLVFGNATVIVPPTSQTQITIVKYSDANGNGTRDSGEGTLAGFNFVVKASDGSVVGTATTGSDGTAAIVGLPLGPYTITETPLTGWTNTDPGGAAIKVAVLSANATTATVSFGNAQIRLPSTSTEDGTANGLLALVLAGAGVAMLVVARRTSHTV